MTVVHFDQQMGAWHAVCWLKSSFSAFSGLFSQKEEKIEKVHKKEENKLKMGII